MMLFPYLLVLQLKILFVCFHLSMIFLVILHNFLFVSFYQKTIDTFLFSIDTSLRMVIPSR